MLGKSFVPLAVLMLSVLGAIFFGVATPTEAASVGALGALVLAGAYRSLSWKGLKESVSLTARTSAMVCFLFVGSSTFASIFAYLGGERLLQPLQGDPGLHGDGHVAGRVVDDAVERGEAHGDAGPARWQAQAEGRAAPDGVDGLAVGGRAADGLAQLLGGRGAEDGEGELVDGAGARAHGGEGLALAQ